MILYIVMSKTKKKKQNCILFQDFLFCGEKERQDIEPTKESIVIAKSKNIITSNVNNENGTDQLYDKNIVVSNATAKWSDNQNDNSLENINFTVKPGQLVAMIGPIGAGKVCVYEYCIVRRHSKKPF